MITVHTGAETIQGRKLLISTAKCVYLKFIYSEKATKNFVAFSEYINITYLINTARKRVSMNNDNIHRITLVMSVVAPSNLLKAIASDVP